MASRRPNVGELRTYRKLLFAALIVCHLSADGRGQDLLNDEIPYSDWTLDVQEFVQMPPTDHPILSMYSPAHDPRLYVSSSLGRIYAIDETPDGATPRLWFDAKNAVREASGRRLNYTNGQHGGLRGFALHPDFANNGKLYLSVMQDRPDDPSLHHYLGDSHSDVDADSVVIEFTYDFQAGRVATSSHRELFRVNMPVYDHPIKQIKFNPFAQPTDEDYGLLYITHGDASVQSAIAGGGQVRSDALGKVLRIDPLASGDAPYTVPNSPFAEDAETLDEIFALGFRNPHNLSFAMDGSESRLVIADIGRDNIEEINLVSAGADYGWSSREGTFVHRIGGGSINGVGPLPANEAENGYTYPAAMFDHDAPPGMGFAGVAVAGSHVIANGSELDGKYIFGDFGNSGRIYHTEFSEMLDAVTTLDHSDPLRDEPDELTQAPLSQLRIRLDDDKDPSTPPVVFDTFTELLGTTRSDFRFGEGSRGELYISSKRNGKVYLVTNSLPSLFGDLDASGQLDAADIDMLSEAVRLDASDGRFDLNRDGLVSDEDRVHLVENLLGTQAGDADLDGVVRFADFLRLSHFFAQAGGWAQGDFDGDGNVAFADFLVLSARFGESQQTQSVPEPTGGVEMTLVWGIAGGLMARRRRGARCR